MNTARARSQAEPRISPGSPSDALLLAALEDTQDTVVVTDASGRIQYVNRSFEVLTGYSSAEAIGHTPSILKSRYHEPAFYANLWNTVMAGQVFRGEVINRKKNGELYYDEKVITPILDDSGKVTHFVATGRDITWQRKAERLLRMRFDINSLLLKAISLEAAMPLILQAIGRHQGAALTELWRREGDHFICHTHWSIPDDIVYQFHAAAHDKRLHATEGFAGELMRKQTACYFADLRNHPLFLRRQDVEHTGLEVAIAAPIAPSGGEMEGMIVIFKPGIEAEDPDVLATLTDIGLQLGESHARQRTEASLLSVTSVDPLTGLANRAYFDERLKSALRSALSVGHNLAVLLMDIDRFKLINDTFGHEAGDRLIAEVGQRLRQEIEPGDILARLGGDQFLALIENPSPGVQKECRRLLDSLQAPFPVGGHNLVLHMSIGVSRFPGDSSLPVDIIREADHAMGRAKKHDGPSFAIFDPELDREIVRDQQIQAMLRHQIQQGCPDLFLHYQPQVDARVGAICGMEALLRWKMDGSFISPSIFIPASEKAGMIQGLTSFVFDRVVNELQSESVRLPKISVNVSGQLIHNPDFISFIKSRVDRVDPARIVFEITETAAIQFFEESRKKLQTLRDLGFRIALDDFGTGHSSLNYLMELPVDIIKIDRGFVGRIEESRKSREIVRLSVDIARTLDLEVIAEGVENTAQVDFLLEHGCHVMQGYLTGPPAALDDLGLS